MPEAVERGKPAVLICDYSLDNGEELYSIKLYKDNVEFYRFVPREALQKQSYILDGVYVNVSWLHLLSIVPVQILIHIIYWDKVMLHHIHI